MPDAPAASALLAKKAMAAPLPAPVTASASASVTDTTTPVTSDGVSSSNEATASNAAAPASASPPTSSPQKAASLAAPCMPTATTTTAKAPTPPTAAASSSSSSSPSSPSSSAPETSSRRASVPERGNMAAAKRPMKRARYSIADTGSWVAKPLQSRSSKNPYSTPKGQYAKVCPMLLSPVLHLRVMYSPSQCLSHQAFIPPPGWRIERNQISGGPLHGKFLIT